MVEATERSPHTSRGASSAPPGTFLFLVIDGSAPRTGGLRVALDGCTEVHLGRAPERRVERRGDVLIVGFADRRASSAHARLERSDGAWILHDLDSTNGTRVDGQRVRRLTLGDGDVFQLGATFFVFRDRIATTRDEPPWVLRSTGTAGLATLLPAYEAALAAFARVAVSTVPLLLLGETGTGKEVLARLAHDASRRGGAFVPVNCGALPETLVESQLFGHAKGAFSGALRDEPGLVRSADGGTLFLDEIGDLPRSSQTALLRVLQEREVTPVGGTRTVKVDLRVVAATHRPVDELDGGAFRGDLYARLAGYTHHLPPLRERREDLGLVVGALLERHAPGRDVRLDDELCRALLAHDWPYNVRELEQCLTVALVFGDQLELGHAPEPFRRAAASGKKAAASPSDDDLRASLVSALEAHRGNVTDVARALGRTRMQVHRWMKRWAIDPESYRR